MYVDVQFYYCKTSFVAQPCVSDNNGMECRKHFIKPVIYSHLLKYRKVRPIDIFITQFQNISVFDTYLVENYVIENKKSCRFTRHVVLNTPRRDMSKSCFRDYYSQKPRRTGSYGSAYPTRPL